MSTNDEDEGMIVQVGAFEPSDAKRVLAELEKEGVPFEVEADHSALYRIDRCIDLYLATYPEGSKLLIFVPEENSEQAKQIISRSIFP
jgi:hypothetical protein